VGYTLDNLSLMALIISVGFVVDDAIVMIENCYRNLEQGMSPYQAAVEGARQIGFTVVSISVSLVAVFIPLLFMGGIIGRIFREFAMTLTFAIAISAVVSLTVTPMICGRFIQRGSLRRRTVVDRAVDPLFNLMRRGYERGLRWSIRRHYAMLGVTAATIVGTVWLYIHVPKGWFPQDDTGLMFVATRASPDVSFETMVDLQRRAADIINADPAVAGLASFVGASFFSGSVNQGRMFVSLKPIEERGIGAARVIDRLRPQLAALPGIQVFMFPSQDVRVGGRQSNAEYLVTVWGPDLEEVVQWAPRVLDRMREVPGVLDVSADRQQGGLQVNVVIDRAAAAQLGVRVSDIDAALNNAFGQRQISTIYTQRNQYRVVLEVEPRYQRDPSALQRIYVSSTQGGQVPLAAVARIERALVPLTVYHQGQFPAVTVSFNVAPGVALGEATRRIDQAVAELQVPGSVRVDYAGNAAAFRSGLSSQPLLILAALITIYIVLGVLYESLVHPITIISTLPAAGLGALLTLYVTGTELSLLALIGILLLMGIVKKNGIMLVDFALEAERTRGLSPERAMYEACLERFRPITMTTMAAICGALPLALGTGIGAELRRPLGLTIIGGLVVSQLLTLFTTPTIYLLLEHLRARVVRQPAPAPAE
jgi:multidrug efflux pump